MCSTKKIVLLLLTVLLHTIVFAQSDPLFDGLKSKFKKTPAYECDINIKVDVEFIKIPQRKGKLKFDPKKGPQYKIDGFAFLPKGNFDQQSKDILNQPHTVINMGVIDETGFLVYKVIPNDINSEVVISQFWVNPKDTVIDKMSLVMKELGNYTVKMSYDKIHKKLPSQVKVMFEVKNQKIPAMFTGDMEVKQPSGEVKKTTPATITIDYTNYKVAK